MNSAEIFKNLSEELNIPIEKVRQVVIDYMYDLEYLTNNNISAGINLANIGIVGFVDVRNATKQMDEIVLKIETFYHKKTIHLQSNNAAARLQLGKYVSQFYNLVNVLHEIKHTRDGKYKTKIGRKLRINIEKINEYRERVDYIINSIPHSLTYPEPNFIQKEHLLKLSKYGVLQTPNIKNSKV